MSVCVSQSVCVYDCICRKWRIKPARPALTSHYLMDNNYLINTHYQVLSQVENIASEALINVLRIGEELVESVVWNACVVCVCLSVSLGDVLRYP